MVGIWDSFGIARRGGGCFDQFGGDDGGRKSVHGAGGCMMVAVYLAKRNNKKWAMILGALGISLCRF